MLRCRRRQLCCSTPRERQRHSLTLVLGRRSVVCTIVLLLFNAISTVTAWHALEAAMPFVNLTEGASVMSYVGYSSERYIYENSPAGACYGVVNYDVFIPTNASLVNSAQEYLEKEVTEVFARVPKWLGNECYVAIKQHVCTSYFVAAELRSISGDTVVHVPSYPHKHSCVSYGAKCSLLLHKGNTSRLRSISPLLLAPCNDTIGDVDKFPTGSQVVMQVNITVNDTSNVIELSTEPHEIVLDALQKQRILSAYDIVCPAGFVVPDHPLDGRTLLVEGSGCAEPCVSNVYTRDEWTFLERVQYTATLVFFPLSVIVLLGVLLNPRRRKGYLLIKTMMCCCVLNVLPFVVLLWWPFEERFCYDNAIPVDQSNAFNMCLYQSISQSILSYVISVLFALQSILLFWKIVLRKKLIVSNLLIVVCVLWFGYGAGCVSLLWRADAFGYQPKSLWCFMTEESARKSFDIQFAFIPLSINTIISVLGMACVMCCMSQVLYKHFENSNMAVVPESEIDKHAQPTPQADLSQRNAMYRTFVELGPVLQFTTACMIVMCILVLTRFVTDTNAANRSYDLSYQEWTHCIFYHNYLVNELENGVTEKMCGAAVKDRLSVGNRLSLVIATMWGSVVCLLELRSSTLFYRDSIIQYVKTSQLSEISQSGNSATAVGNVDNRHSTVAFVAVSHFSQCEDDDSDRYRMPGLNENDEEDESDASGSPVNVDKDQPVADDLSTMGDEVYPFV